MNNKLKNPVWFSLNETHKNFTIDYDVVKFYNPEVCPFGAFTEGSDTKNALNEYAKLTDSFFLVSENGIPDFDKNFITLEKKMEGCQMVLENLVDYPIKEKIIPLTKKHQEEIYNLIWLVMPGYYKKRTFEMGKYFGIFKENKLVAIAGQRMQTDDWIEISGIVTHPDHTRKGYAKQLTAYITAILCAFLTYGYLNPMFFNTGSTNNVSAVTGVHGTGLTTSEGGTHLGPSHADIDVSHVALFILSVSSAFVGLALGSLLPRPLAGVTLGCGGALLVTALVPHWILSMGGGSLGLFTVLGPVMSLVGGVLTTR